LGYKVTLNIFESKRIPKVRKGRYPVCLYQFLCTKLNPGISWDIHIRVGTFHSTPIFDQLDGILQVITVLHKILKEVTYNMKASTLAHVQSNRRGGSAIGARTL